ncbi:MAG TPA: proline--tRNA ligase [bacterium]|nr:proline--tRNA ligase [bacterium]
MRYSTLFPKTRREPPREANNISTKLLYQAGFIRESTAGRYYLMPLGMRVQNKIIDVVRDEMNRAGAQEMISPVLHPLELWKETNRTNTTGFELMKVTDRRGAEFALGGTAEEMFVDVVRSMKVSYRDLPFNLYQFSQKFRDEMRARGGLLRVREFLMKDAYSFDVDEEHFKKEYENMWQTYTHIFDRLGLPTVVVESDNGYIGGEYCHEFVVESEVGESRFLITEDGQYAAHEDVARFDYQPKNPNEPLEEFRIVDQPEWVCTMEENVKYYQEPLWRYLKNVVYRTTEGDIVIAATRGDMQINQTKLEHLLGLTGQLIDADENDLKAIGTKHGYVHCWGHEFIKPRKTRSSDRDCRVIYVADEALKYVRNFIGGQKEKTTDSRYVNYGRDFKHEIEGDISIAQAGYTLEGKKLEERRGIEVGNIFQLGYHYSKLMQAAFVDTDGQDKLYYMGCYGIGIGRTLATIVEISHDDKGMVWPELVAPFTVHLLVLGDKPEVIENAEAVYRELIDQGVEVLFDDRIDCSAGVKFADADLIGIPYRFVISPRTVADKKIEVKRRVSEGKGELIDQDVMSAWLRDQQGLLS